MRVGRQAQRPGDVVVGSGGHQGEGDVHALERFGHRPEGPVPAVDEYPFAAEAHLVAGPRGEVDALGELQEVQLLAQAQLEPPLQLGAPSLAGVGVDDGSDSAHGFVPLLMSA